MKSKVQKVQGPKTCPKCGKDMSEEPEFKGLWTCPDFKVRLTERPPFRFKCTGMELTEEGGAALVSEIERLIAERN